MLVTSKQAVAVKYSMFAQIQEDLKKGDLLLDKEEHETYTRLTAALQTAPLKGLCLGLATPLLCALNRSTFGRFSTASKVCLVLSGPVTTPAFMRLRSEYRLQNYLLYLRWKQVSNDTIN